MFVLRLERRKRGDLEICMKKNETKRNVKKGENGNESMNKRLALVVVVPVWEISILVPPPPVSQPRTESALNK